MNRYSRLQVEGFEEVVQCDNDEVGFTAWIAIHNSSRGPALGGCRVWAYQDSETAITDVLRLSRGMTYKNALAKLDLGGGKMVVNTNLKTVDRSRLFTELGNFVETLDGRYITAEDMNSTVEDMAIIRHQTEHVATVGASGNPSPFTAYGVYCAIKASVASKFGRDRLYGLKVAVQGLGETGGRLAELLYRDNCQIIGTDINSDNIQAIKEKIELKLIAPEEIYSTPCDVFAPCALGGILNPSTTSQLQCQIIAGSANNQLLTETDGERLHNLDILYAPDFVINSGGVINISCEINQRYNADKAKQLTSQIGDTLLDIYNVSIRQNLPTNFVANELAEELFQPRMAA